MSATIVPTRAELLRRYRESGGVEAARIAAAIRAHDEQSREVTRSQVRPPAARRRGVTVERLRAAAGERD